MNTLPPPRPRNAAEAAVVAAFGTLGCEVAPAESARPRRELDAAPGRKSFDFFVRRTGPGSPLLWLVEVKQRRDTGGGIPDAWVSLDDTRGLASWEVDMGDHAAGLLVFVTPPNEYNCRHLYAVTLRDYVRAARVRSRAWQTVYVPPSSFRQVSRPINQVIEGPPPPPLLVRVPKVAS